MSLLINSASAEPQNFPADHTQPACPSGDKRHSALGFMVAVNVRPGLCETDSECLSRRLAAGLASEYKEIIPYVKIPCGLCRRVLH